MLNESAWTRHVASVIQQALSSRPALDEVLSLVAEGHWPAILISQKLEAQHLRAVNEARVQALSAGRGDYRLVRMVRRFVEQPDVHDVLTRTLEQAEGALLMECAAALGRADEPKTVEAVRLALTTRPNDMGSAQRALEAMQERLPELQDDLRTWILAHPNDERLAVVAEALCRSGEVQVPAPLLQAATAARVEEAFHGFFTGIAEMDQIREQPAAARAHRTFLAKDLGVHIEGLKQADDRQSPLWPQRLQPEPHPASWEYLTLALWPRLEAEDTTAWYRAVLIEHLHSAHACDHHLLLGLVGRALYVSDHEAAFELLQAGLQANVFDASTRARLQAALRRVRLALGQQALHEGQLAKARSLSDALLADQPGGEALLFDTRLTAQERGPEAVLACVEGYLGHLGNDPVHHGRVLAEKGRAQLALQQPEAALATLQQAAQLEQGDPDTLSLLAQVHHVLGRPEAKAWANLALQAGADPAPLKAILPFEN